MAISNKIILHFPRRLVDQPIISRLVSNYGLEINILKAYVTPREEGLMVLELSGEQANYEKGIKYLTDAGVLIQPLSKDIICNESRCNHCGACVTICPTGAFEVDPVTRRVNFLDAKCIACELCIKACPPRAMEVHF